MMTFKEFQATKIDTKFEDGRFGYEYTDGLQIHRWGLTGTGYPYLEIANEFYQASLEELELILYGWALEEGYFGYYLG